VHGAIPEAGCEVKESFAHGDFEGSSTVFGYGLAARIERRAAEVKEARGRGSSDAA